MSQSIDRIKLTFGFGVYSGAYGSREWLNEKPAGQSEHMDAYRNHDIQVKTAYEQAGCEPGYIATWRVSHLLALRFKRVDGFTFSPYALYDFNGMNGALSVGDKMAPFMRTRVFLEVDNKISDQNLTTMSDVFVLPHGDQPYAEYAAGGFMASTFVVGNFWGIPIADIAKHVQINGVEFSSDGSLVATVGEKPVSEYVSTEEVMRKAIADAIEQYKQLQGDNNG